MRYLASAPARHDWHKEMTMVIRSKAPLRISFAGGGTDVSPFLEREGGCVLSATVNKYTFGALHPRDDNKIQIASIEGLQAARQRRLTTVGLTGHPGGALKELVDFCLCVPAPVTPRLQEAHILVGHSG